MALEIGEMEYFAEFRNIQFVKNANFEGDLVVYAEAYEAVSMDGVDMLAKAISAKNYKATPMVNEESKTPYVLYEFLVRGDSLE